MIAIFAGLNLLGHLGEILGAILVLPALFLVLGLIGVPGRVFNEWFDGIDAELHSWISKRQVQTALLNVKNSANILLLCVVVLDDEAGRWLGLLRSLCNVLPLLSRYIAFSGLVAFTLLSGALAAMFILLVVGFVAVLFGADTHWLASVGDTLSSVIAHFWTACWWTTSLFVATLAVATVLQVSLRSHRLGFGGESIVDNLLSDILIAETPLDLTCEIFRTAGKGFHHSFFFDSPVVVERLSQWIKYVGLGVN